MRHIVIIFGARSLRAKFDVVIAQHRRLLDMMLAQSPEVEKELKSHIGGCAAMPGRRRPYHRGKTTIVARQELEFSRRIYRQRHPTRPWPHLATGDVRAKSWATQKIRTSHA